MARAEAGGNAGGLAEPYLVGVRPSAESGGGMGGATLGNIGRQPGVEVRALEFRDDRLARELELLSDDERWRRFEAALNGRCIGLYKLKPERVRMDTTTGSGSCR